MLSIQNLSITFTMYDDGLRQKHVTPVTDLDLDVRAGEVVAVVGSSGSGKSLLAHAVLGLLPGNARVRGTLLFKQQPLSPERQQALRGREIALVPQSVAALDPLMRVERQAQRAARLSGLPPQATRATVERVFQRYGLAPAVGRLYPFQLSGGMARRVLVATAAIGHADLIIADEPTPGLHPDSVTETLRHLRELADEGRGVIVITHDIEAALRVANRVAVFYAGTTVEIADALDFAHDGSNLRHPYSQALWRALPQHAFVAVPGAQPNPEALPQGCLFADRCWLVTAACRAARPPLRALRGGLVRCINA